LSDVAAVTKPGRENALKFAEVPHGKPISAASDWGNVCRRSRQFAPQKIKDRECVEPCSTEQSQYFLSLATQRDYFVCRIISAYWRVWKRHVPVSCTHRPDL